MNDDGKNYESEYSLKDLDVVEGLVSAVLGNVHSMTGKSKMVSMNINHVPFLTMVEVGHGSEGWDEFEARLEPMCEVMYLAMLPGVFFETLFKMIAHGVEEDDLREDVLQIIYKGVATGMENARSTEGDT